MVSTAPNPAQLARTGRAIAAGIWVCAAITMTASVVNGTSVFAMLVIGVIGVVVGLLTALAVDACLVMVLCGDRQMQALGLSATWGRVLRVATLGMSLALNCGAALIEHSYFLAALHAIPPLLIVGMSEYGQEVMLTFTAELRRRESARLAAEKAQRDAQQAIVDAENVKRQRIKDEDEAHRRAVARQNELTAAAKRTADETARQATEAERLRKATEERAAVAQQVLTRPHLVVDNAPRAKPQAKADSAPGYWKERATAWLRAQHDAGRDYQSIGPADIAAAIGAKGDTCKKSHRAWKAAVARELELIADLTEAVG